MKLEENIVIEPNTGVKVNCIIASRFEPLEKGVFQPDRNAVGDGIVVDPTFVDAKNPCTLICNYTDETQFLPKGSIIGQIDPVDDIVSLDQLIRANASTLGPKQQNVVSDEFAGVPEHLKCMVDNLPPEITPDQVKRVEQVVIKHKNTFLEPGGDYGETSLIEHTIDIGDAKPVKQAPYKNKRHATQIDEFTEELLKNDKIEPSSSPWSSPVLLASKPNGAWRFCVEYRK
jgi:hypothetical protein